jgi:hypothetical protein
MLRISKTATDGAREPVRLILDGQITGRWVAELRRVCLDILDDGSLDVIRLELDLTGVSFLDTDGLALFRDLAGRGVLFTNCSPFTSELLKGVSRC